MPIVLQVIIRSFLGFFLLLFFVKIIGKQQVTHLTYFDYIVGITIGSAASTLSVQINENTWSTMAGMAVWAFLAVLLSIVSLKSPWLRKVIVGIPEPLIQNGKISKKALKKNKISLENLTSMLRSKNVFNIEDVEFAVFEPDGKLSVLLKSQKRPLTPEDMNISTEYSGMPTNIIVDGILDDTALYSINLTRAWLEYQLGKANIDKMEEIFLAQLDTQGNLYIDMKDNKTTHVIQTK